MALALYRTYRPGSLAEVIGQEHVTDPLGRALAAGRVHHAYLFSGPRGCGKTSTARILARSLNCQEGPTAVPCGTCRSCVELAPNGPGSLDVVELDAATHRGIDDARELREKAVYAPAASRYKVYIIDEAHQLTNEAANALLKLVEEPPPHLRFIFATTEPDKIIPTIRSRTFHYGFRLVPARVLADHLAGVCRAEGVPAEPAALAVVARAGAGSVRDSLSVLGQLLAGAGPDGLTYVDAVSALGLTDASLIDAFVDALAAGSAGQMFTVVESVISAGHDPRRFVADVLDRLRDLIILRADPQAAAKGLLDLPDDAVERMLGQAQSLGLAELSHAADLVSAGLGDIKGATAPRLQLELLCTRLVLPSRGDGDGSVLARLERIERVLASPLPVDGTTASARQATVGRAGPVADVRDQGSSRAAPQQAADAAGPVDPSAPPAAPAVGTPAGPPPPAPPRRPTLRSTSARGASDERPGGTTPTAPVSSMAPAGPAREAEGPTTVETADPAGTAGRVQGAPARGGSATDPSSGSAPLGRITGAWPAILERLATSSRVAWTAFHAATPVSVSDGALAVALAESGNVRAIAQRGHDERLRQAIIDVVGIDLSIDVLHNPDAARGAGQAGAGAGRPPEGPAGAGPGSPGARPPGSRGRDLVRDAGTGREREPEDSPSSDDPDLEDAVDGLALITRELGARPIGEIDHS